MCVHLFEMKWEKKERREEATGDEGKDTENGAELGKQKDVNMFARATVGGEGQTSGHTGSYLNWSKKNVKGRHFPSSFLFLSRKKTEHQTFPG